MILLVALVAMALAGVAQQIAVVSGGTTTVHQTLKDAIEHASNGSVIYLPGGGFSIGDSVKITKRVTIVGIGHKTDSDNEDGSTIIGGNLWFNNGSSGSSIMGCYLTGNVNIGEDGVVNNVIVRLCNINSVQVKNSGITGTMLNQNYVRGGSSFEMSEVSITNNVIGNISNVGSGNIKNNVVCGGNYYNYGYGPGNPRYTLSNVNYTIISSNIFCQSVAGADCLLSGTGCQSNNNYLEAGYHGNAWGDNPIIIDKGIDEVLVNVNGWSVSPKSSFHFKDEYQQYEHQVGIYSGTGFSDGALPPVPYIVAKRIADQTDAAGRLKVQIRVNAGPTN